VVLLLGVLLQLVILLLPLDNMLIVHPGSDAYAVADVSTMVGDGNNGFSASGNYEGFSSLVLEM